MKYRLFFPQIMDPALHNPPVLSPRERIWRRFIQWVQDNGWPPQDENALPEPTEVQYLAYFAHLWETQRFLIMSLWVTYNQLSKRHKEKYGQGLEKWPIIAHALLQYQYPGPQPVFLIN